MSVRIDMRISVTRLVSMRISISTNRIMRIISICISIRIRTCFASIITCTVIICTFISRMRISIIFSLRISISMRVAIISIISISMRISVTNTINTSIGRTRATIIMSIITISSIGIVSGSSVGVIMMRTNIIISSIGMRIIIIFIIIMRSSFIMMHPMIISISIMRIRIIRLVLFVLVLVFVVVIVPLLL